MPATRFVVQLHDATTLHFDLRIQVGEVLRSWAVPKGPSLDPAVRRLAIPVEDHELSAGEFEGVHEGQLRGTGAVIIWDEGPAEVTRDEPGHLSFTLHGSKLAGGFALTRTGARRWILVKAGDATARPGSDIVAERPASVRTGRSWEEVAARQSGQLGSRAARSRGALAGPHKAPMRARAPGRSGPAWGWADAPWTRQANDGASRRGQAAIQDDRGQERTRADEPMVESSHVKIGHVRGGPDESATTWRPALNSGWARGAP